MQIYQKLKELLIKSYCMYIKLLLDLKGLQILNSYLKHNLCYCHFKRIFWNALFSDE